MVYLLTLFLWLQPALAGEACLPLEQTFDALQAKFLQTLDNLAGHIRNTRCLVPSCDPSHGRSGQCFTSSQSLVLQAQSRFQAKMEKTQLFRQRLKVAFEQFSRETRALGGEVIADPAHGFSCQGAGTSGAAAMEARKAPLLHLASTLRQYKVHEHVQSEYHAINRDFAADVAQMKARPYRWGPITVHLPCVPQLSQEYEKTRRMLAEAVEHDKDLEQYLKGQVCRLNSAKENFTKLLASCDTAGDRPVRPGKPVVEQPRPAPVVEKPVVDGKPVTEEKPAPDQKPVTPSKPEIKNPDFWSKMTREEWAKNDEYKESMKAPVNRVSARDPEVSSFLSQARASGRDDYALRLQAAINATSTDYNGEGIGPAPSVYQDGVIGSRTRGAVQYYMSDPDRRAVFLENLRAYGIEIR